MMEMTLIAEMMMNIRMMKIKRKRPIVVMISITTAEGGTMRIDAPRVIEVGRSKHGRTEATCSPVTNSPTMTARRKTNVVPRITIIMITAGSPRIRGNISINNALVMSLYHYLSPWLNP